MLLNDACWVSIYSVGIGVVFMLSFELTWRNDLFLKFVCIFHFLEYFSTALYNPTRAFSGSFLIPHSNEHTLMLISSIFEYNIEYDLVEKPRWLSIVGIFLVIIGQFFRTYAMKSANVSFNHKVQEYRANDHVLVTTGAYSVCRHPSYFGFYWWSIGTQILLGNAVCSILYFFMLTRFFNARIEKEEEYLTEFFGQEYENYRKTHSTLIPFVN
eukprot:NODE_947_length_2851_cov_0.490189.p2 type:complete len:213 gc:universal NODE_947_length_2851_cov_0.490189:1722-2360(+)